VVGLGHPDDETTLIQAVQARQAHLRHAPPVWTLADLTTDHWSVRNETELKLVSGAVEADMVLLVIDASGGLPLVSLELLKLWYLLGVERVVIFLDQVDKVKDASWLDLVEWDARTYLARIGYFADEVPIVRGRARAALNSAGKDDAACRSIDELMAALDALSSTVVPRCDRPFLLDVEHVFHVPSKGTVFAGRIDQGKVTIGDRVEIIDVGRPPVLAGVVGVEMINRALDQGQPGDNVGIMLRPWGDTSLPRGAVLAAPGSIQAHVRFEAVVYLLVAGEPSQNFPVRSGYQADFRFSKKEAAGTCVLPPEREAIGQGQSASLTVELAPTSSVVVRAGQHFTIFEMGQRVGWGTVTVLR
jgi:elongation factor Tu